MTKSPLTTGERRAEYRRTVSCLLALPLHYLITASLTVLQPSSSARKTLELKEQEPVTPRETSHQLKTNRKEEVLDLARKNRVY